MQNPKLSIFCVVNTKSDEADIFSVFISDTFDNAKLWFQSYVEEIKENWEYYILYKIGEFTDEKELKIKPYKILVCSARAVKEMNSEERFRLIKNKLYREEQEKKEREVNKTILNNITHTNIQFNELIDNLFNGKVIYEK